LDRLDRLYRLIAIGAADADAKLYFPSALFPTDTDAGFYMGRNVTGIGQVLDAVADIADLPKKEGKHRHDEPCTRTCWATTELRRRTCPAHPDSQRTHEGVTSSMRAGHARPGSSGTTMRFVAPLKAEVFP
jgi:hypothetical protein